MKWLTAIYIYVCVCVCMHVYVREWMVWGAGAVNHKILHTLICIVYTLYERKLFVY